MNFVKLIFNESKNQFEIEKSDKIYPAPVDTEIQTAVNSTNPEFFKNLTFGINVIKDNSTLFSERFPPLGVKLECCDSASLLNTRMAFEKESTYFLEFWLENQVDNFKHTYEIPVGRPAQPYASWTWNGDTWIPPSPSPENCDHAWNEETLSWKILS